MELQPPRRAPGTIACALVLHRGLKLTVTAGIGSAVVRRARITTFIAPAVTIHRSVVRNVDPANLVPVHATVTCAVRVHAAARLAVRVRLVRKRVDRVLVRLVAKGVPVNALVVALRMMKSRISSLSVVQRSSEKLDVSVVL